MQAKQQFLRTQILESEVNAQSFMAFLGTIKGQGENIDLQSWTLDELQNVVKQFKKIAIEEIRIAKMQMNSSRNSKEMMTSKIMMGLMKKEKVYYDRDGLWDYEIYSQQECKKTPKFFELKLEPEIDYKNWEIKKTGGFLFGIGAKNELQITLITNFTTHPVVRKVEDVDWLRESLCIKFPGSFIPPLEQSRYIDPEDKIGIMRRIKQVLLFLNSMVNFDHLLQSQYFFTFISQNNVKDFYNFKSKQIAIRSTIDISSIENMNGQFSVEISKRVLDFVKQTSEFGKASYDGYVGIEANLKKIMGDLETLTKHAHYVAHDFTKFSEKYTKLFNKCGFQTSKTGEKMGSMFTFLSHMFTNMGNQFKKQIQFVKEITDDCFRYTCAQWAEYSIHQKKFNNQMSTYLTAKLNLLKKKERNLHDVNRWELNQKESFRISRINTSQMQKEEAFEIMFPKDNRSEEEMRIWQAYINDMYQKSFKTLINEQQKQYLKYFGKFCNKMEKLCLEQRQMYLQFDEIYGTDIKNNKQHKIKSYPEI